MGRVATTGALATDSREDTVLSVRGLGVSVLHPLGGYYLLRLAGMDPFMALLFTTAVSAAGAARAVAQSRNLRSLDAAMLLFTLAALGQSLIHGNPRFLLVNDSGLTGLGGLWFLLSARTERPLGFVIARALLERRFRLTGTLLGRGYRLTPESWATVWDRSAPFRRIWRVATVAWGVGSIADAAIRLIMAMTLPLDAVPGLNAFLYPATFVIL